MRPGHLGVHAVGDFTDSEGGDPGYPTRPMGHDDQGGSPDRTRAIDDLDEVEIREAAPGPAESTTDAAPLPETWIGRVLDARYRISEVIGEGGFGFVFRAKHLILGRDVAVKILQTADGADPLARARFERESSMLAALQHPHIVTVTDFGVSESLPYLVMELVDGQSLRALMDRHQLAPERALRIVVQILKALSFAHEHGIVHRDLKPANVLVQSLGGEDHAKLLDFGFAKFFGEAENKAGNALTAHGTAFGTTGYVAPEQLGSAPIDGRVDLYAASVMIFELIAGRRPFQAVGSHDAVHELRATLLEPPPSLAAAKPELPLAAALDPILVRGLAKDPAARFESAAEMGRALEELLPRTSAAPIATVAVPDAVPVGAPRADAAPARPNAPPRAPSVPMIAALLIVPALAITALAVIGIGWSMLQDPEPTPAALAAPAPPPDEGEEVELGGLLLGPPVGDRPAPADPWAGAVPPELAEIRAHLDAGEPLGAADRRTLNRMIRAQPWDARPHLLIGYAERRDRSLTVAIQSYERAYRASPASRGDEHMLTDLVVMASHPTAGDRAAAALETIYGPEALPALDRAIAVSIVQPRTHERLRAVRERLAGE